MKPPTCSVRRTIFLFAPILVVMALAASALAQVPLTSLTVRRFTVIDNNQYQLETGALSAAGFVSSSSTNAAYSGSNAARNEVLLVNKAILFPQSDWDALEKTSGTAILANYRRSGAVYSLYSPSLSSPYFYVVEWIGTKQVVADSILIRRFSVSGPTSYNYRILRLSASGAAELSSAESGTYAGSYATLSEVQSVSQINLISNEDVNGLVKKYGVNYLKNFRISATLYSLYSPSVSTPYYQNIEWQGGFPDTGVAVSDAKPINISTRLVIAQGGQGIMGFVVAGTAPTSVLVRAVGPTLAAFGVGGTMADPRFTLNQGSVVVGANDDWGSDASSALVVTQLSSERGAFALAAGSKDAAKVFTLQPGAYTVVVQGVNGAGGEVIMEVYF